MEERKFVCKFCNKRFPCGKSLGGHIRTHMSDQHSAHAHHANAAVLKYEAVRKRKRDLFVSEDADAGFGVGVGVGGVGGGGGGAAAAAAAGNLIYGLRENPKKTMRFVHSNATLQLDKFCKECGKGFPSLKALCGHMACHSEKEKGTNNSSSNNNIINNNNMFDNNNTSGISEKQKSVTNSQSDTETSAPRRSMRMMRFKNLSNNHQQPSYSAAAAPPPLANGSSSVSEVEQEQEEVARCLMMLSKDNSHKGRFALFTESSDNNSVVLEAKSKSKSPSLDTKVTAAINNGKVKDSVSNGCGVVEKKLHKHRDMKFRYAEIDYDSDNSDSGYFRYGPKEMDSDDSNEGYFRNEVKASKVFGDYDVESRKMLSRGRSKNSAFKKLVLEDSVNGREDGASRRRPNYDSFGQNSFGVSSKKIAKGFVNDEVFDHGGKGWKYEFLTREKDNVYDDSAYESDEKSTDTESYPAPKPHHSKNLSVKKSGKGKKKKLKSKKSKEHECPICNKVFRSGQALGGHKRSHFIGVSDENTLVIRPGAPPAAPVVPCLIDLNLPASVDE